MGLTGITNYTFAEFLLIENSEAKQIIEILEWLSPVEEIEFESEIIFLKHLDSLTFGQVTIIRDDLNHPTPEAIIEVINLITGIPTDKVYELPIIEFYSVLNTVKQQAIRMSNLEANELTSTEIDADWEAVQGSVRMSKFGVLNVLDSLAGGDITKYEQIENLPYLLVFQKLRMLKEMSSINKAIAAWQRSKNSNK